MKPGELHEEFIKRYQLNPSMQFDINHMIAIILYTDYTNLQNAFSRSFRRSSKTETLDELKSKNSEFAHWSRAFRESVEVFGQSMKSTERVYHGVNKCLLFSDTIGPFCSPTSTTTLSNIALNFADDKGMVLTLRKYDSIHYLDVSGISSFGFENERLFVGGYNPLRIISIFDKPKEISHDNSSAVPVITTIRELISGKGKNILGQKGFPWLFALIEHAIRTVNDNEQQSESDEMKKLKLSQKWPYSCDLWQCWRKHFRGQMTIDFNLIVNKYSKLIKPLIEKRLLFTNVHKYGNHMWIEPQSLCSICPNVKIILIKNSKINQLNNIIGLLKEFVEYDIINDHCCKLKRVMVEVESMDNKAKEIIKLKTNEFKNWTLKYSQSKRQIIINRNYELEKAKEKIQQKLEAEKREKQKILNEFEEKLKMEKEENKILKEKLDEKENKNAKQKENKITLPQLLKEWNLEQYEHNLTGQGYDDIEDCFDLTLQDLTEMDFKPGHAKKFKRKLHEFKQKQ